MIQRVCAVMVTYGNRFPYAEKVIKSLLENEIGRILVVGNRIAPESRSLFERLATRTDKIRLVVNRENLGSAIGFGIGIKEALSYPDCEFIWLLDDDTAPRNNGLAVLLTSWQKLRTSYSENKIGLICFRPDHQVDIARGMPVDRCYSKPGCFFGFHFFNIPYRLWRFTPWGPRPPKVFPEFIKMPYAAYGGFFAHRSVYQMIGLPMFDYILYEDDLEYTLRLTRKGGTIFLCFYAQLDSQEASWGSLSQYAFGMLPWLKTKEDFRIYYGARNVAYFEKHYYDRRIIRNINRLIYLTVLFLLSVFMKKKERFKQILQAIREGEASRLGYNKSFPLP